jgi:hypothetical protein
MNAARCKVDRIRYVMREKRWQWQRVPSPTDGILYTSEMSLSPCLHTLFHSISRDEITQFIAMRYIPNWRSSMAQHTYRVRLTMPAC